MVLAFQGRYARRFLLHIYS